MLNGGGVVKGAQGQVGNFGLGVATAQKVEPLLESPCLLAALQPGAHQMPKIINQREQGLPSDLQGGAWRHVIGGGSANG